MRNLLLLLLLLLPVLTRRVLLRPGAFVTEACRASGHGECLSYICGCPCHE